MCVCGTFYLLIHLLMETWATVWPLSVMLLRTPAQEGCLVPALSSPANTPARERVLGPHPEEQRPSNAAHPCCVRVLTSTCYSVFLIIATWWGVKLYLTVVLICISLLLVTWSILSYVYL